MKLAFFLQEAGAQSGPWLDASLVWMQEERGDKTKEKESHDLKGEKKHWQIKEQDK